jgi:hypothetical protein
MKLLDIFRKFLVGAFGFLLLFTSCMTKDEHPAQEPPVVSDSENLKPAMNHPPVTNLPATKSSDAENQIAQVAKEAESCEQIHDSTKPDTIQGNQMDLANVKAGDKIAGLTIAEITKKIPGVTDDNAISIRFCGNMKVSGAFVYHKNHEYFSNAISFVPDNGSLQRIPLLSSGGNDRKPLIVFHQIPVAVKEKLGEPEIRGTATFEIANYNIRRAATEIWDVAEVLNISNVKKHVAATLPDGTPLFENQSPVKWGNMLVQIINNGNGRSGQPDLKPDVFSQIASGTDGSGVEVYGEQELEANSKTYTLALVKQNGENKYVLLEYVPHPSEKDITLIHSIVVTTDEKPEMVKTFLAELAKTWKPSDYE